jgi:hypothetical protein
LELKGSSENTSTTKIRRAVNKLACGETAEILDDKNSKKSSPTEIKNKSNKKKKNKGGMNFAGKNRAVGGGGWQNHWNSKKDFLHHNEDSYEEKCSNEKD